MNVKATSTKNSHLRFHAVGAKSQNDGCMKNDFSDVPISRMKLYFEDWGWESVDSESR